jgi:hypothetical protein
MHSSKLPFLTAHHEQDLPPDVKPLLRDPRQTSRTGGNSKRHIYAYRGVCRQARKGHDRWQSQISFMGVNHYLGTFDRYVVEKLFSDCMVDQSCSAFLSVSFSLTFAANGTRLRFMVR